MKDKFELNDTGVIRLPHGEDFVSFMKIKRKLYVLSNKAIYQIKEKRKNDLHKDK